jgi:hypothetical protein
MPSSFGARAEPRAARRRSGEARVCLPHGHPYKLSLRLYCCGRGAPPEELSRSRPGYKLNVSLYCTPAAPGPPPAPQRPRHTRARCSPAAVFHSMAHVDRFRTSRPPRPPERSHESHPARSPASAKAQQSPANAARPSVRSPAIAKRSSAACEREAQQQRPASAKRSRPVRTKPCERSAAGLSARSPASAKRSQRARSAACEREAQPANAKRSLRARSAAGPRGTHSSGRARQPVFGAGPPKTIKNQMAL